MPLRWDFKMDLPNCTLMMKRLTLSLNSNCSGVTKTYIKYITSFVNEKLKYVLIYSTQTKKYSHQMVNLVTDIVYEQGGKFLNAGL